MKQAILIAAMCLAATGVAAKLPAPVLTDEAKAKAAEATAKIAHTAKVDGFKLCQSMDQVAAGYYAGAKKAGKDAKPPTATAACADPGVFVYVPPAPAAAAAAPAAPALVAAAPATAVAPAATPAATPALAAAPPTTAAAPAPALAAAPAAPKK